MKAYAVSGFLPVIDPVKTPNLVETVSVFLTQGVNALEIPFSGPVLPAIREAADQYSELILCISGITTEEMCRQAAAAKAKLIMMPFFSERLVKRCLELGVVPVPTCAAPAEFAAAQELGLEEVQVVYESVERGISELKAFFEQFPQLKVIPSGEITRRELPLYISLPNTATVRAPWFASCTAETVAESCADAHRAVLGFQLAHVGVNSRDLEACQNTVRLFTEIFGFASRDNGNSIYVSDEIEIMKFMQIGSLGHLAIRSNSVERAALELEKKGLTAIASTRKYRFGRLNVVYYQEEIGGFGIHLIQRNL